MKSGEHFKNLFEDLGVDGLWDDLVNLAGPSLLDELLLDVASTGHNHGLGYAKFAVEVSNLFAQFVTVHDRHADVSQHEPVHVRTIL